jgi:uncharacterized protein YbaA (DUF1428 family)
MAGPRTQPGRHKAPFDGKRLVYAGFQQIVRV